MREEEDAPERRGFQDRVDLRLSAIEQTNARKRKEERERETQKSTNTINIKIDEKGGMYA